MSILFQQSVGEIWQALFSWWVKYYVSLYPIENSMFWYL